MSLRMEDNENKAEADKDEEYSEDCLKAAERIMDLS